MKISGINNRRYLGNKYKLLPFIKEVILRECGNFESFADIFSGTGAVASAFTDKNLIVNDLLYSNYICHCTWFGNEKFNENKIARKLEYYNSLNVQESNYVTENFADTYFDWNNCSKIGFIREDIEQAYIDMEINFREKAILITSLLYAMDKIANTVGHYDAYRKIELKQKSIELTLPLKNIITNKMNRCFNIDANILVKKISADVVYIDPPYNSRQYSDAYHLIENIARWEKPIVSGVAKKMDRTDIKSDYCTIKAPEAFKNLIRDIKAKYIIVSYNNTENKSNGRSNAKINDVDIMSILSEKGDVEIFSSSHKAFTTGKSTNKENIERLFVCKVFDPIKLVESPLNYTGSKFKILDQLLDHFPRKIDVFVDLFSGGCNVGANVNSDFIVFNDIQTNIARMYKSFIANGVDRSLDKIENIVDYFELSNSSKKGYSFYGCNSSEGLINVNKVKFNELRRHFNSLDVLDEDYSYYLFVLIVFSFNNQIRFNKELKYNLPVGKRDFNKKMKEKFKKFVERLILLNVSFTSNDFRDFDLSKLTTRSFVYIDPPYLITTATYNESGGWTENDEGDLLNFIDDLNDRGIKFGLSNVIEIKGKTNQLLKDWMAKRNYKVIYINSSYANSNYQTKNREKNSIEVYITNYGERSSNGK